MFQLFHVDSNGMISLILYLITHILWLKLLFYALVSHTVSAKQVQCPSIFHLPGRYQIEDERNSSSLQLIVVTQQNICTKSSERQQTHQSTPAAQHLLVIGREVVRWFTCMLILCTGHIDSHLQIHLQHFWQPNTKLPKKHRPEIPTNTSESKTTKETLTQKLIWTLAHLICEIWCSFLSLRSSDCRRNRIQDSVFTSSYIYIYIYTHTHTHFRLIPVETCTNHLTCCWNSAAGALLADFPQSSHSAGSEWSDSEGRAHSPGVYYLEHTDQFPSSVKSKLILLFSSNCNRTKDCWTHVSSLCHVGGQTYH